MGGLPVRHGSGAGSQRDRERDRSSLLRRVSRPQSAGPLGSRAQASSFRNIPFGPQEEQDFTAALEAVHQRLDSLENMQRKHGQEMAVQNDTIAKMREEFVQVHSKIDTGNSGLDAKCQQLYERHTEDRQKITIQQAWLEQASTQMQSLGDRFETLQAHIASYQSEGFPGARAGVQHHEMHGGPINTPQNVQPPQTQHVLFPPPTMLPCDQPLPVTPPSRRVEMQESSPLDGGAGFVNQEPEAPTATAGPFQANPQATGGGPFQSNTAAPPNMAAPPPPAPGLDPWAEYRSAEWRRNHGQQNAFAGPPQGQQYQAQGPMPAPAAAPSSWVPHAAHEQGIPVEKAFSICRKKDESIWIFKGTPADYKDWRDRIVDHCCITNRRWRAVLDYVALQPNTVSIGEMQKEAMTIDGYPLTEVANIFFDWLSAWIPKRLYLKRVQLAGNEFGNGLELWRKLRVKYEGSSDICDVAGVDLLHTFPKCKSSKEKEVEEHLDDYEELVDLYGKQLQLHAPMSLRVMLLRSLPKELEDEILDKPHLRTMEEIIEYLRQKLSYRNQKSLASYIRPSSQRMSALRRVQEDESEDDEDDNQPTARASGSRGRSSATDARITALTDTVSQLVAAVGQKPPQRRAPSPKTKTRFAWKGGCHECGGDHMKRECQKWKKLMSENNDKIPDGHVNAYTKARDAYNKKNGITPSPKKAANPKDKGFRRTNIKALLAELDMDSDFSDSDSDAPVNREFCDAIRTFKAPKTYVHALTQPAPVKNSFQALANDDEEDASHIAALNDWAHQVKWAGKKSQRGLPKRKIPMNTVITNEEELDDILKDYKYVSEMLDAGSTPEKLAAVVRKTPSPHTLQPGEVWAMVDSGSGVDGFQASEFASNVPLSDSAERTVCITANGDEMVADKEALCSVELDGQPMDIPFKDLPLTMPILSMRRHIHRGHSCRIQHGGGYFRNLVTRKKSRFVEKDGVYFIKMRVNGPSDKLTAVAKDNSDGIRSAGFTRPGAAR